MLWMREAFKRLNPKSVAGIDEQSVREYAVELESNLGSLLERAKKGTYRAPPVKRKHIPKNEEETRPIGIPTTENKVLERAVVMLLEAIYEIDFMECSYGFRVKRSAHQALESIRSIAHLASRPLSLHDRPRLRGGGAGAAHVPGVEGDFGNVADGVVDNADGGDITHDPDVVELVTPEQFAP